MLVLGIDPGTATTGYALIKTNGIRYEPIAFGLVETLKANSPEKRLLDIFKDLSSLFETYRPDVVAMEKVFFARNAKTVIAVGQSQGVIMMCAAKHRIPLVSYSPMTIKKVISGNGKADKEVVKQSVRKLLGIRIPKKKKTHFDNAADALAIAVCYIKETTKATGLERPLAQRGGE